MSKEEWWAWLKRTLRSLCHLPRYVLPRLSVIYRGVSIKFRFMQEQLADETSVWLCLQTNDKGTERRITSLGGSREHQKEVSEEQEETAPLLKGINIREGGTYNETLLKLVNVSKLGNKAGRCLVLAIWAVPFVPELVALFTFFAAVYISAIAFALSLGKRYMAIPLILAIVLHLPFVWIFWFPPTVIAYSLVSFGIALHTRLFLLFDTIRILSYGLLSQSRFVPIKSTQPHSTKKE